MSDHYIAPTLSADGETADAADINSINTATEAAFDTLEAEVDANAALAVNYSTLSQGWAATAEDTVVPTQAAGSYSALHYAAKASASATAASASETAASSSASSASSSASSASTSASNASTSETNASNSAAAAAASETAAGLSETAAAASAAAAAASAASLDLDGYTGAATIVTLGTVVTGTWNADIIAEAYLPNASDTAQGVVELAVAAEINTGTDTGRAVTPDALAGSNLGTKAASIYAVEATTNVTVADGKTYFTIPACMDGMNLIRAQARVITAGTTNATTIDIYNVTKGQDMLSTAISIASGASLGTVGAVNSAADDVSTDDLIRIDVTTASDTKAKGLVVHLEFRLP